MSATDRTAKANRAARILDARENFLLGRAWRRRDAIVEARLTRAVDEVVAAGRPVAAVAAAKGEPAGTGGRP